MPAAPTPQPKRPRGRPPDPGLPERRRRELVEAAFAVFAERGYQAAGIADITARLNIGQGTFYRYFQSKRDVLDHVIDFGVGRVIDAIREEQMPADATRIEDLAESMVRITERLFALLDEDPGIARVVMLEATAIDDALTARILALVETFDAVTRRGLEHGVRQGFVRADLDVHVAAAAINSLLLPGFLRVVRGSFPAEERARLTRGLIDFACRAIEAR